MLSWLKVDLRKTTMNDRSTDIFGPVEENSDDSVEEEEEPEEEQEKDEISSIFEEEEEVQEDNPDYDPWCTLRQKWGMISKTSTRMKSSSSWIGENPKPMPRMPLSMPYYLYREEGYEGLT